ncbi:hypothetical protein AB7C87_21815 [Natrarchaeobius sp. A-rgal3]|uniref:hypothetical protein n=1 Tax=Natrarchaeobius versutus TaxID=1679078 RepID=UPI00350EE19C
MDRPRWPEEPTSEAIAAYAARDHEVAEHNRSLEETDGTLEELHYGCSSVYEAETGDGHVVLSECVSSSTVDPGPFQNSVASHGVVTTSALLADETGVVRAGIDRDDRLEGAEAPYSTRGFLLVNFTDEPVRATIDVATDGSSVFEETYDVETRTGVGENRVVTTPDSYDVTVRIGDTETQAAWNVSEAARDPIVLAETTTLDLALGLYVLPDGAVEIHNLPAERPTA